MSAPASAGKDVRPAVPEIQRTSDRLASSSGLAQVRRARRLIERWAERIGSLARDETEPAWADKAAILGSKIAALATHVVVGGRGQ
jgi:hypothetical protein